MAPPLPVERISLDRLPRWAWALAVMLALSVLCAIVQGAFVRPYVWPAGTGARLQGDPASRLPFVARPADIRDELAGPVIVGDVAPDSPAAFNDVKIGDAVLSQTIAGDPSVVDLSKPLSDARERLATWRALYWQGARQPVSWKIKSASGAERDVTLHRVAGWRGDTAGWASRHLGAIVQAAVFIGGALLLFLLRSSDPTAGLCVLALALSGVAGGGPLLSAERLAGPAAYVLTVFSWIAASLAFPVIALAILYFPTRSELVERNRWLVAVPLIAALPMIVPSLMTALYLTGVEAAAGAAVWDATHPGVFYASFAVALGINLLAVVEGTYRYRYNHDVNERRRIRMVLYTAVPGIVAYAVKEGIPAIAAAIGTAPPLYPLALTIFLQSLVLMPAFGLVYAVGVARVLGPRVVLRRSLQYALANRTLSLLTILPGIALAVSLVMHRDKTLREIVAGSSGVFFVLLGAAVATLKYRERARQWLDQRFFREEYDARKILLSLSSRVRFESNPADLANMVVTELDQALHPQMAAILVGEIEQGVFAPVAAVGAPVAPLPQQGGILSMLRWSDEPLEIYLGDPRSPARRLPADERAWLETTGAVLLVPVTGEDRALIALIAVGERRSEEAYTAEDRELLRSIATQMGVGFDVARLRRLGAMSAGYDSDRTGLITPAFRPMMECPRCGRCEEADTRRCTTDGAALRAVDGVPKVIDGKYRLEQLLGRGGMGGVYRARDMRLDRLVAVKVVRAELMNNPEAWRRFRREAQIIARLQHPSIVAIFDYGTFPHGGAYLVMELVRGEDLRRLLQKEGRLELRHAMRILTAVCDAIETAHRSGVLHRDLKPENILLPGDGVAAKVLDFGVAKVVAEEPVTEIAAADPNSVLTHAGMIIGTPAYMAPEQFQGAGLDGRTDVFSLGVLAYEMLTGELPFGRGSLGEVVLAQTRGAPPMTHTTVPQAAERAIRNAMDINPDRRPPSPQAFAHLLAASLGLG